MINVWVKHHLSLKEIDLKLFKFQKPSISKYYRKGMNSQLRICTLQVVQLYMSFCPSLFIFVELWS